MIYEQVVILHGTVCDYSTKVFANNADI